MAANEGAALTEFFAAIQRGQLPAAAPFTDVRSGARGLAASGSDTGFVEDLVWSDDLRDRAAAAVMACTNTVRAAEHDNSALQFAEFERRTVTRLNSTEIQVARPGNLPRHWPRHECDGAGKLETSDVSSYAEAPEAP